MVAIDKAWELINKYWLHASVDEETAIKCALIAVDEIIDENDMFDRTDGYVQKRIDYLEEVKQELEKLKK
jgi:hypothetical protein